jgi:hypothetical protein
MSVLDKRSVLETLTFGARIAEDEKDELASYFVETDQWTRVASGSVDVVFGPKGAGKSAIYTTLMNRERELSDRGIILISAENPRGSTVFSGLTSDPPTSEVEFIAIWKTYILTLVGSVIVDYGLMGDDGRRVRDVLIREGLLPPAGAKLSTRLKLVLDWVKRALRGSAAEGGVALEPVTQVPVGVSLKISLGEPSVDETRRGVISLSALLEACDSCLRENDLSIWVLFDRLDVAFAESRLLEANGIRALFRAYGDLRTLDNIALKIFLRSDIWDEITGEAGFREASHITKKLDLQWGTASLLNLVARRAVKNDRLIEFYAVSEPDVLESLHAQRKFIDRLFPDQVDVGKNPKTFDWILGRVMDGTRRTAPREVIHLLTEARNEQVAMLDRGEEEPPGTELLSRAALRSALEPVSQTRLQQTLYAEYPVEKPWIQKLEGQKTEQSVLSLAEIWDVSISEATVRALRLREIGFFEQRGSRDEPSYWVPFLYRLCLDMRQGSAETQADQASGVELPGVSGRPSSGGGL